MSDKWDRHFLSLALAHAQLSKDPNTKCGAVIVDADNCVLSMGFNGFPRLIADTPERLGNRETKLKLMVHAEMNAVLAAARKGIATRGGVMYIVASDSKGGQWGGVPCTRCTVEMLQAGIDEVVSLPFKTVPSRWSEDLTFARELIDEAGLLFREIESL